MIHTFSINGDNIAVDINSGAIHVFDSLSFDILSELGNDASSLKKGCPDRIINNLEKKYSVNDIKEAYSEIFMLYTDGELYSKPLVMPNIDSYTKNTPVKALCLHIAHDCNLKCDYCFASKGDFGTGKKLMPFETGKAAIDFVIGKSKGRRNIEVDFFGGEPLMNFETVKKIVDYARTLEKVHNKNFRFTITTNGVLLDNDKINYINKEMSNVVLSIDGRRDVNDNIRKTLKGIGTYDIIMPKFKELVQKRDYNNYYVRGTFTSRNLDFSNDVIHLYNEGFDQISVEPAVCDEGEDYAIRKEHLPAIFKEYEALAKKIADIRKNGGSVNFFHFMMDFNHGPCAIKRIKGCGSGTEYLSVTPEGNVYPCHQFVGNDKFIVGNVHKEGLCADLTKMFENSNLSDKRSCDNCFAKYFCCGGCNANNYNFNENINIPHDISCEIQKKRLECAIYLNII